MALPMLVNGAECGPVNPLQGLAKRFDQDRGIQQDQFGLGHAGPSREVFRTTQKSNPVLEQEAARFFRQNNTSDHPHGTFSPSAFDLSLLHNTLPAAVSRPASTPMHSIQSPIPMSVATQQRGMGSSAWAADFLQQSRPRDISMSASPIQDKTSIQLSIPSEIGQLKQQHQSMSPIGLSNLQWNPMRTAMFPGPQFQGTRSPIQKSSSALLDKEFQSLQASLLEQNTIVSNSFNVTTEQVINNAVPGDELARTAGMLIETVKNEQNPKFKNSAFMRLMHELRDGNAVVQGNEIVERGQAEVSSTDAKGKGKERENFVVPPATNIATTVDPSTSLNAQRNVRIEDFSLRTSTANTQESERTTEDPNDAYFRQENQEYIDYWNSSSSQGQASGVQQQQGDQSLMNEQQQEWGDFQDSWDSFESSTWGVRPLTHYQFQPNNPYLYGNANERTRAHSLHSANRSIYDSVLELEAEVQRDANNAAAWYNLGVKQQENERESKAIIALRRSLELDSSHLPTWLALAISHTNEGDRVAADEAVEQWIRRNSEYQSIVTDYFTRLEQLNGVTMENLSQMRRHDELVHCLMGMARSRAGLGEGEVDADVQIALAVLLNTSEDYLKAQDCFKAALSVRPEDWQLYNRVGATLANSGMPEEAFQYYFRALELNPAYIRARFNIGISCMNMRRYEEAAHYIFEALVMQDSDGSVQGTDDSRGITSSTLWDSLRATCLHLQRSDLATLCERRDIEGFRREFHI